LNILKKSQKPILMQLK